LQGISPRVGLALTGG